MDTMGILGDLQTNFSSCQKPKIKIINENTYILNFENLLIWPLIF